MSALAGRLLCDTYLLGEREGGEGGGEERREDEGRRKVMDGASRAS